MSTDLLMIFAGISVALALIAVAIAVFVLKKHKDFLDEEKRIRTKREEINNRLD